MPTTPEGVHIAGEGVPSCRGEDADARDLLEDYRRRKLEKDAFELPLDLLKPVLERADLLKRPQGDPAHPDGEQNLLLFQELP